MCQEAIAATDVASFGPSKRPQPWMQAYSVPDRLTPSSRIVWPLPLMRWLPDTLIESGAEGGPGAGGGGNRRAKADSARTSGRFPPEPIHPVSQPVVSMAMRRR